MSAERGVCRDCGGDSEVNYNGLCFACWDWHRPGGDRRHVQRIAGQAGAVLGGWLALDDVAPGYRTEVRTYMRRIEGSRRTPS